MLTEDIKPDNVWTVEKNLDSTFSSRRPSGSECVGRWVVVSLPLNHPSSYQAEYLVYFTLPAATLPCLASHSNITLSLVSSVSGKRENSYHLQRSYVTKYDHHLTSLEKNKPDITLSPRHYI